MTMAKTSFEGDVVIGLEIHVPLLTATKLFCSCPLEGGDEPNTRTCPVCLGHPGSRPVLNQRAVEYGVALAKAFSSRIAPELVFSRKSYFYPDLAKNYQITQYELPLGEGGQVTLPSGKQVHLRRIHLEEDPAALVHPSTIRDSAYVLIDYNRSGHPLCEVVTEPDIATPAEAREFLNSLLGILEYLELFDPIHSVLKVDANVSVKESGYCRVEVKNISGFRDVERALSYEIARQKKQIEEGAGVVLETRGWDSVEGVTFHQRSKETEEEYGYIIDGDLVPIDLAPYQKKITIPELPLEKAQRFAKQFRIELVDAMILCQSRPIGEWYEEIARVIDPILAKNWFRHEFLRIVRLSEKSIHELDIRREHVVELLSLVGKKKITDTVAKEILEKFVSGSFSPSAYIKEHQLCAVSDEMTLEKLAHEVVLANPGAVAEYKAGKEKALNFLVGKVMAKTKGAARADMLVEVIKKQMDKK